MYQELKEQCKEETLSEPVKLIREKLRNLDEQNFLYGLNKASEQKKPHDAKEPSADEHLLVVLPPKKIPSFTILSLDDFTENICSICDHSDIDEIVTAWQSTKTKIELIAQKIVLKIGEIALLTEKKEEKENLLVNTILQEAKGTGVPLNWIIILSNLLLFKLHKSSTCSTSYSTELSILQKISYKLQQKWSKETPSASVKKLAKSYIFR